MPTTFPPAPSLSGGLALLRELAPLPQDLLKWYAAIQILADIMANSSWRYPHAAFKNDETQAIILEQTGLIVPPSFLESSAYSRDFKAIYDAVQPMALEEFLNRFLPDLVTQRGRTWKIIEKLGIKKSDQALAILLAKMEWLSHFGELPAEEIFAIRVRNLFSAEEWKALKYAVNCYSFSYQSVKKGAAFDAHKVFEEYRLLADFQIYIYCQVRKKLVKGWIGKKLKWRKTYYDYAHYLRGAIGRNPKFDMLEIDAAVNAAAEKIGNIERPTDFLEAVLVNEKNDDSKLENDFVFSKFVERIMPEDKVLVINPSPDFLCQYPEKWMARTTFCVPYQSMAVALEHQFSAEFMTFQDDSIIGEHGKSEDEERYTKILLFARDIPTKSLVDMMLFSERNLKKDMGRFYALFPERLLSDPYMDGDIHFDNLLSYRKVDILPHKSVTSSPRKKVFLEAVLLRESDRTDIEVTSYQFLIDGEQRYLEAVPGKPVYIPQKRLHAGRSIPALYREQFTKPPKESRKEPASYSFSPEITFWYTVSKRPEGEIKVEAYVSHYPVKRNGRIESKFLRGNKVKNSYASISTVSLAAVEGWCESELPYKPRIQRAVVEAYDTAKRTGSLPTQNPTLKTLWYIHINIEEWETNTTANAEKELFSSGVGKLKSLAKMEEYQGEMERFLEGESDDRRVLYWSILNDLLNELVDEGWMDSNPIEPLFEETQEKSDNSTADVRAALAKKTFRIEEERQLLSFLIERLPEDGEYLAVLIRFFTGLEPNIISALTWGDIHQIADAGVYQFWIYQQYQNGGKKLVPLMRSEDFRRVPIVGLLYKKLKERKDYITKELGISKGITKLQIIAGDRHLQGDKTVIVSPRRVNDLSRRAVFALGIEENVVDLPDADVGTKETDLASFHGDIFRANFRYQANFRCGFTDSEIRYVLGQRQMSTFGQNYCDYLNTFAQLSIYQKLCRWTAALVESGPETSHIPQRIECVPFRHELKPGGRMTMSAIYDVRLNGLKDGCDLCVESPHGLTLRADLIFQHTDLTETEVASDEGED